MDRRQILSFGLIGLVILLLGGYLIFSGRLRPFRAASQLITIEGTVASTGADTIDVQSDAGVQTVRVGRRTTLFQFTPDESPIALKEIAVGDRLKIKMASDAMAVLVEVFKE